MSIVAIGIDLGTTYSCVAVYQNDKVEVIANDHGYRTTPSYVGFTEDERLIGDAAKNQVALNPINTLFDAKRLLGRIYTDPKVQEDMKLWPFEVINEDYKIKLKVKHKGEVKKFYPEEVSSMVLNKMKKTAQDYLGENISKAVITVPAYFTNSQRQATIDAAKIAGLDVLHIINEPTAAAIAYGFDKKIIKPRNILVFDLGGGTFDVSILVLQKGEFCVKATAGDTHLGGGDFDIRMMKYFIDEFKLKYKLDITNSKSSIQKLRNACEFAKRNLSFSKQAKISIDALYEHIDFKSSITQTMFENINSDLFLKTLEPVRQALKDANLRTDQINDIILVGGSTRIPKVQDLLQNFFNGKQLNRSINPDEAVAYGAAVQAAILIGDSSVNIPDMIIRDVTPLSLGINVIGGFMSVVMKRNTEIPTQKTERFQTTSDNQEAFQIKVLQGERPLIKDNELLGTFYLRGIVKAPAGVTKMDVTFKINANGVLVVTAVAPESKTENEITIYCKGRLTKDEINKMVSDAEKFRLEDEIQKQIICERNRLDALRI